MWAVLSLYRFIEISEVRSNIIKMLKSVSKSQKPNIWWCSTSEKPSVHMHWAHITRSTIRSKKAGRTKKNLICNFKQMENKSNPNKCVRSKRCVPVQCSMAGFIPFLVSLCAPSHHFLRFTWIFFHDGCARDFIFITLLFTLCADFILPSWSSMDWMRQKSIQMGDGKILMIREKNS